MVDPAKDAPGISSAPTHGGDTVRAVEGRLLSGAPTERPPSPEDETLPPSGGAGAAPISHDSATLRGRTGGGVLGGATLDALRPRLGGRAAGRYEVLSELGRGGMGAVFRVLDRDLGRDVAMKVMLEHPDEEVDLAARFVEEARATALLEHPAIVPVHDIGLDEDGKLYFTMKLVAGRTLARVIEESRRGLPGGYSQLRLLSIFVEITRAVAYAHRQGIVHRDLKPQNIMIGPLGEAQVMDWGLAKVLARAGEERAAPAAPDAPDGPDTAARIATDSRKETQYGTIVGTPQYMAPEQAQGDQSKVGPAADVYALGSILYHVLTGRPPFVPSDGEDMIAHVIASEPARPRFRDPQVPRELEAICLLALRKKREARYPSAEALAEDVQSYLEHLPVHAYPEGPLSRAWKALRRHRRAALAGALLLAAAAGGLALDVRGRRLAADRARDGIASRAIERAAHAMGALDRARAAAPPGGGSPAGSAPSGRSAQDGPSDAAPSRRSAQDTEERRRGLDRRLALGLEALEAYGQAEALSGGEEAKRGAFRAAMSLGEVAAEGEQWSLAESALERAIALDVDDARARAALADVERGRTRAAEERRRRVEAILADARSGALAARPSGVEDAVFALVGLGGPETVDALATALEEASAALSDAEQGAYRDAGAQARHLAALGTARALAGHEEPDPATAALVREAHALVRDAAARRGEQATRAQDVLGRVQERRLGAGGVVAARLACEALGRIGVLERALPALAGYLGAEDDEVRATPAGIALCLVGGPEAERHVLRARRRFGPNGPFWERVSRVLARTGVETPLPADTVAGRIERAYAREAKGDFAGAREDLERAVLLDPGSARALNNLGNTLLALGQADLALGAFDRAIAADAQYARAYLNRGIARRKKGQLDLALADLDASLALDAQDALAWANRGLVRADRDELPAAIADDTRAIALLPALSMAWNNRGIARLRSGDLPGAAADFTRAVELDPHDPAAWTNRGNTQARRGELDAALSDFGRAIEVGPRFALAWNNRGLAREQKGDPEGALADYGRAVEIDERYARAWSNRALLRERTGDRAGARADWTRVQGLAPTGPLAEEARAALERLRGE